MSSLGNKKVFAENLLHYMELNHKTRNDVCEDLGFKYTTFTDWVKGVTYPRIDKIELMANYFGIQKSDLIEAHSNTLSERSLPSNLLPVAHGKAIPIIGTICAGTGLVAYEERLGSFVLDADIHADFSLRVEGDSMVGADIQNGDVAFFIKDFDFYDGAIYAVLRKDTDEAILRRVTASDDRLILSPCNDDYTPIIAKEDDYEILAKLIGTYRKR